MRERPYSTACERNQEPILAVLREHFASATRVLEIGSGTGQHAVHFAAALPHLVWQASDRAENLPGIEAWRQHAGRPNLPPPLVLDVMQSDWPDGPFDGVFSANTLHIMGWGQVERMFARLPEVLATEAIVVVYGPFHRGGRPTSASNAAFDASLRAQDPAMGVRELEAVRALAEAAGLDLVDDRPLPANNACLVWRRPTR